jgi:NAD dependent epimerase/dehydratase family enzyme
VLGGAFVSADRLVRSGFRFRYSHLREALQSLVG